MPARSMATPTTKKRQVCRGVVGEGGKGAHQPDQGNNHCDEANCNQIAVGRTCFTSSREYKEDEDELKTTAKVEQGVGEVAEVKVKLHNWGNHSLKTCLTK
jgi:hypothetical protein